MNKINIRGVIVPSSYDAEWANAYIEKGQFIPESRVRSQIAAAEKDKPLDIYVNSPGGSVFAGNEIINNINGWAAETGQEVNITVGALAASMAAAMLVCTSAKVRAHKNAKLMFHGAWGVAIGGEEGLKDQSELLGKMTADMKSALLAKSNLEPEKVDEWFKEGRQGWLTAQEAKDAGIISEIIEDDAEVLKLSKSALNAMQERGLMIAAALDEVAVDDDEPETGTETIVTETVVEPEPEKEESNSDDEQTETTEEEKPEGNIEEAVNEVAALTDKLEASRAKSREWQASYDKAMALIEKMKAEHENTLNDVSSKLEKAEKEKAELSARLTRFSLQAAALPEDGNSNVDSWVKAVATCNGDFAKAKAQFPQIHQAYFEKTQKNRK